MSIETNTHQRSIGIDLAKTIAIIGVIIIHISGPAFSYHEVNSLWWNVNLIMASAVRASVPLFLMCSGALMLSPEKDMSFRKLFLKTIPRILAAMIFWGMGYKIYHLLKAGSLTFSSLWQACKEVALFNQEFHFYYMHIILIVYVFLPITRTFIKNASKQMLLYALGLWFVFGILYPTAKYFWPFTLLSGMTYQWLINMTYASVGYGILGYYLKKYPLKNNICTAFVICGFLIVFIGTYIMSAKNGYLVEIFFEGMSAGVAFLAVGIYGLCMNSGSKASKINKASACISKASFCIYLVHMFFINELYAHNINAGFAIPAMSVPLLSAVVFLASIAVYFLVSGIPLLRKWII